MQVSQLERQVTQIQASSEQNAKAMEKKLHQACWDLEDRTTKLLEADNKIRYMELLISILQGFHHWSSVLTKKCVIHACWMPQMWIPVWDTNYLRSKKSFKWTHKCMIATSTLKCCVVVERFIYKIKGHGLSSLALCVSLTWRHRQIFKHEKCR